MKNKPKVKFRIGAICLIALFLLLPLLSSPVAAVVNFAAGTGTSTNPAPPTAPTVVITMSPPMTTPIGATPPLICTFNYNFVDTNGGGTGSNHICTMTVTQTAPAGPPPVVATTGLTFIAAGSGTTSGVLTTSNPFTPPGPGATVVFTVSVTMTVTDVTNPARTATGFGSTTVTIR